jgi:hypothetical protein
MREAVRGVKADHRLPRFLYNDLKLNDKFKNPSLFSGK